MAMSRYETILNLKETFFKLINAGLIPIHLMDWKVYYEAYVQQCEKDKPHEAACMVAANYDISRRHLYKIIAYMKGA